MTYKEVLKKTAAGEIGTQTFNTLAPALKNNFLSLFGTQWNKNPNMSYSAEALKPFYKGLQIIKKPWLQGDLGKTAKLFIRDPYTGG